MNCKECFYFVADEHLNQTCFDKGGRCFFNPPVIDPDAGESADYEVHSFCWIRPIVCGDEFCANFRGKNS